MQNAMLDDSQDGIRNTGRNISNHRYVDDTILMVESEEKLKSLLIKMKKESEKASLKQTLKKHSKKLRSQQPVP